MKKNIGKYNAAFPTLASYDVLRSTLMLTITTVASAVIFALSIFLALWNTIFAVKGAPAKVAE